MTLTAQLQPGSCNKHTNCKVNKKGNCNKRTNCKVNKNHRTVQLKKLQNSKRKKILAEIIAKVVILAQIMQ